MKNKKLLLRLIAVLALMLIVLTGCGNQKDVSSKEENEEEVVEKEEVSAINDNNNYFIIIDGEKFNAGDKISDVSKVGLKQSSKVLDQEVSKNTYMIGAGSIYNSDDKIVCNITPFNPTDDKITVADAVIGGIDIGEYQYDKIPQEVLDLNIEVCGGIKLGSSYDDVKEVFGETEDTYTAEELGYTKYTYESEEIYRSYEFTVDKDGKVSEIQWRNLVFNH